MRDEREVVRWFNAESRLLLETQWLRAAPALGVDIVGLDEREALARVRGWFETTERPWLLVFDNVAAPEVLNGLIPAQGDGGVVITSRHRDWSARGITPLQLGVLSPDEALELLGSTSGRAVDAEAAALVEDLGRLALAVEQAGAYLAQTGWDHGRYRQLLLASRASELLARNPARLRDAAEQDVTVVTVWDISVEQAKREAPAAEHVPLAVEVW